MEELVLSTFSDTKPILKNDIETMLLKKNVIDNETSIEINVCLFIFINVLYFSVFLVLKCK